MDGTAEFHEGSPENKFIQELLSKGIVQLKPKYSVTEKHPALADREFYITYRTTGINPPVNEKNVRGKIWYLKNLGATQAIGIDLFERKDLIFPHNTSSEPFFIPFGHRDYSITAFTDGDVWASGNFSRHRNLLPKSGPIIQQFNYGRVNPYEIADNFHTKNGIDVIGKTPPGQDDNEIRKILTAIGLPTDLTWQGYGFGKLMEATSFEVLRRIGVKEIDFGSVSKQYEQVLTKLFAQYSEYKEYFKMDDVNKKACLDVINQYT